MQKVEIYLTKISSICTLFTTIHQIRPFANNYQPRTKHTLIFVCRHTGDTGKVSGQEGTGTKAKEAGNKAAVLPASLKISSSYKQVKTVSGTVWVYLPEKITAEIFELGCKYQAGLVSKEQAIEVAESIADKIADTLDLDNKITPLAFLSEETSLEDENN